MSIILSNNTKKLTHISLVMDKMVKVTTSLNDGLVPNHYLNQYQFIIVELLLKQY